LGSSTECLRFESREAREFNFSDTEYHRCSNEKGEGGALSISHEQATACVTNCDFRECSAGYAGGVAFELHDVLITRTAFATCSASGDAASFHMGIRGLDGAPTPQCTETSLALGRSRSEAFGWHGGHETETELPGLLTLARTNATGNTVDYNGCAGMYTDLQLFNFEFCIMDSNSGDGGLENRGLTLGHFPDTRWPNLRILDGIGHSTRARRW
jgi:hypothetical protein